MSRQNKRIPKLRHHKPSGLAVVTVRQDGKPRDIYLGPHGSQESHEAYARIVADVVAARAPERSIALRFGSAGPTVAELVVAWWEAGKRRYGAGSKELESYRSILRDLNDLYGSTPAGEFTARDLRRLRDVLIAKGRTRRAVNRTVTRVRTVFRWGGAEGLVSPSVPAGLALLRGLRRGEDGVAEAEPRRPVHDADVEATLPHLPQSLADFVRILRLCGCRPGELARLRACDIDTTGEDVWWAELSEHKSSWRDTGKARAIPFGPQARAILERYIGRGPTDAPLFSPALAMEERRAARTAARRTPQSCGNRPGTNRLARPTKTPGAAWKVQALGSAVATAIRNANKAAAAEAAKTGAPARVVSPWSLYQLRHRFAHEARRAGGLEAASNVLGHSSGVLTAQVYTSRDRRQAADVVRRIG